MAGRHLLIDFYEVSFDLLDHAGLIEQTLLDAAKVSNATILHHSFHKFAPQGVSGVIVIAESHISIHTWPEEGYAALDIFTCGETMQPDRAVDLLKAVFKPGDVEIREVSRGDKLSEEKQLPIKDLAILPHFLA